MSEWWVGRQGANPVGPVSTDTLVRGIVEKKVPEDALVCRVGETQWQHIPQVEEIWDLVHPDQEEHTNVTKLPWFASDKPEELPELPEAISDADDESTRVIAVPILPMRTIDVEEHPKAVASPKPAAGMPGPPIVASRPQPAASNGAQRNQPAPAAVPAAPKSGLQSAPGFSAPGTKKAATAANAGRSALSANASQPSAQSPKGVISPPRFGTERVSARPPAGPAAKEVVSAKAPSAPQQASQAARQAPAAPGFTASNPARPAPESEPPDSGDRPSVPIVAARPSSTAQNVPLQASRPAMPTPPQVLRPHPAESKVGAVPPPPPAPDPTPIIVGYPRGPVDYDDDTVTVIAKSPIAAQAPKQSASSPEQPPPPPPPMAAPREHTPIMPMGIQRPPTALAPEAARGGAATTQPDGPPPPPLVANKHTHITQRSGPSMRPSAVPPASATATDQVRITQPSAVHPPAVAKPPPPPEVEPADLFDEDFEAPPAPPVVKAHVPDGSVRPAAGTPSPPSVIVTHRPPSMHDELLSHAVPHINEETRPALRSLRAPGTVQISVGALIIGALAIIVVVLFVVLLLR